MTPRATMLERAASAVEDVMSDAFHENRTVDPKTIARAVLMAVREPDDATVTAACDHGYYCAPELEVHFGAMIDAILSEGPK